MVFLSLSTAVDSSISASSMSNEVFSGETFCPFNCFDKIFDTRLLAAAKSCDSGKEVKRDTAFTRESISSGFDKSSAATDKNISGERPSSLYQDLNLSNT